MARQSNSNYVYEFMQSTGMIRASDDTKTRHDYKTLAEEQGLNSSTERSSITPLTRSSTIKDYRDTLKDFRGWCKANGFGGDFRTMAGASVTAYLNHKVVDDGIGRQRINNICSVINKAGYFGGNDNLNSAVADFRRDALPDVPKNPAVSRAFDSPEAVIKALGGSPASLAAEIQLRTGLRAENALSFKINADGQTVSFISKGGMPHPSFDMPKDLIDRARAFADTKGNVSIMPYRTYCYQVNTAAKSLGECITDRNGKAKVLNSHAFRHCFARNYYAELKTKGFSDIDAKAKVSESLFHNRLEIVEVYLR